MAAMVDEMFDRTYQSARAELNAGVRGAFAGIARTIGASMETLHRIEWNAPWTAPKKPARRA